MIRSEIIPTLSQLSTERLNLALMTKEDWPHFYYLQTHPKLMAFIRPVLSESTLKDMFDQRTAPLEATENRWFAFIIRCNQTNDFIGSIAFKINDMMNARAEIGYLAHENAQGKGFISEAANCIIQFLFNDLNVKKVIAQCATKNIGSWKVMEKIGMYREGTFKAHQFINGDWLDSFCYATINHSH